MNTIYNMYLLNLSKGYKNVSISLSHQEFKERPLLFLTYQHHKVTHALKQMASSGQPRVNVFQKIKWYKNGQGIGAALLPFDVYEKLMLKTFFNPF